MMAVPAPWDGEDPYDDGAQLGRRARREAQMRDRAGARELRWQRKRLAVPYRTDGPKVTFGVIWFVAIVAATLNAPLAVAIVFSLVAGLAALQVAYAWFPNRQTARWWTALAAIFAGLAGFVGLVGLVVGAVLGTFVLLVYLVVEPSHSRTPSQQFDVLLRASLPVGIAAAAVGGLAHVGVGAALALILLISAYETGDFLVGSGSSNAVEGPISGLVALGVVLFILWIVAPDPFTASSILLFGALAAVCCPIGQIFASALLPRGASWAPALRRIDSYLLAAPLWLVLLHSVPTTTTL